MAASQLGRPLENMELDESGDDEGICKSNNGDDSMSADISTLRRTNSAPHVNIGVADEDAPVFVEDSKCSRTRTFSTGAASMTPINLNVDCRSTSLSPKGIGSPAPRVIQLRTEESIDEVTREVSKERDNMAAMHLSRSWDEITWLTDKNFGVTDNDGRSKRDSIEEGMLFSNSTLSSPVRFIEKLCHNRSLTPSPISAPISPKQRTFRRSLSPSSLRLSLLSSKRKLDTEDMEQGIHSPAKRASLYYTSVSTSSASSCSSPDQPSDMNGTALSCQDDFSAEHICLPAFLHNRSAANEHLTFVSQGIVVSVGTITTSSPLSCDTRNHSFPFVKPRYIAPQSPLAAGANSASLSQEHKRVCLKPASYAFAPVKEPDT